MSADVVQELSENCFRTVAGGTLEKQIESPRGEPDNTLSRAEIAQKALSLAAYASGATPDEMNRIIARVWRLRDEPNLRNLLTGDAVLAGCDLAVAPSAAVKP